MYCIHNYHQQLQRNYYAAAIAIISPRRRLHPFLSPSLSPLNAATSFSLSLFSSHFLMNFLAATPTNRLVGESRAFPES